VVDLGTYEDNENEVCERLKSLKLGDFGLAQLVSEPLFTVCGTPTYVAPEILAETGYGVKVSIRFHFLKLPGLVGGERN
jgi:serine/threonine protein kinase